MTGNVAMFDSTAPLKGIRVSDIIYTVQYSMIKPSLKFSGLIMAASIKEDELWL